MDLSQNITIQNREGITIQNREDIIQNREDIIQNRENNDTQLPIASLRKLEISLAPMLEVTTANFRRFVRLTSKTTILFTEMIVSNTVLHISRDKLLERLGKIDDLTVVQLGGSDPKEISTAILILQELGCKSFNLNVGCPSSRVQKGCFGAMLMKDKELVADIVNTVYNICNTTLSLKIRVGVDDFDSYDFFRDFTSYLILNSPVTTFYVHGRKCWLDGLSPKQNRNIPTLNYDFVYKIKEEFPQINFILNGGLRGVRDFDKLTAHNTTSTDTAHNTTSTDTSYNTTSTDTSYNTTSTYTSHNTTSTDTLLDGMMIGREAIKNILVFKNIEEYLYGPSESLILDLVKEYLSEFDPSSLISFRILSPLQHILHGKKGTKKWKIFLNDSVHKKKLSVEEFTRELDVIDLI